MSQKKGSKPIRITLTEDQISDIIQSAAKTRRSLSAQSLEDRIAPSSLPGLPLDPGLVDPGSNIDLNSGGPVDPNAGLLPGDPPPPDGFILPPTGPNASDLNPPVPDGQAPFLGTTPPTGDGVFTPPVPPPLSPPDLNPLFDPATHHQSVMHSGQGAVFGGDGYIAPPPGPFEDPNLNPNVLPPTTPPVDPGTGTGMPTPEEFAEHRRNILRQLRGI